VATIRKHDQCRVIRVRGTRLWTKDYEQAVPEQDDISVNGRSKDGALPRLLEPGIAELAEQPGSTRKRSSVPLMRS
jgi:hypothetical protein